MFLSFFLRHSKSYKALLCTLVEVLVQIPLIMLTCEPSINMGSYPECSLMQPNVA